MSLRTAPFRPPHSALASASVTEPQRTGSSRSFRRAGAAGSDPPPPSLGRLPVAPSAIDDHLPPHRPAAKRHPHHPQAPTPVPPSATARGEPSIWAAGGTIHPALALSTTQSSGSSISYPAPRRRRRRGAAAPKPEVGRAAVVDAVRIVPAPPSPLLHGAPPAEWVGGGDDVLAPAPRFRSLGSPTPPWPHGGPVLRPTGTAGAAASAGTPRGPRRVVSDGSPNVGIGRAPQPVQMAYDWGREVAEYAAMHAERSTCRRFVRLAFRDGCTDSRAPADDASGFKVGCDVAFLSPTVAHIVNAAERGGFVEHKTGIIYFSCNYAVLSQVVVFLYLRWLENACGKDMRVPDFTPLLPDILSIMDLAVYLDLPALVELCVLRVAENFAEVETLDGLPSPLIRKILNSLDPRGLSLAEGILANSDAFALGSVDDRDFAKAWTERALDLVDYNTSRFLEIVGEELGSPAEAVKVARLGSLENLLAASDVRNDSPASFSQILELMAREGRPLRTLSICLERVGSWGLADWVVLSRCLPGVTSVRLESRGNCLPLETVAWILSAFKGSRCSLKIFVKVSEPQGEAIWLSPLSDWCHSESGRGRDPISHREDLTAAIESKSHLPFHVPNPQQPMTFPSAPNGDRGPVIDLILESSTKSGCSEQELALLFEQIQSLTIVPIVTQLHVSRLSLGAFLPTRLVSSSSTSLTQLHLRQVNLGATGVLDLLGQLSFTGTHLISLDLAANIARSDQRAAEAGFAISKWLATATASRLRCLGLSRNYFCSAGALAIAEGCKPPACPSLTEVDCSGLDLGIALPRLVHALLGSNQSRRVALRSLNVSDPSAPPRLLAETLVLLTATSGVGGTGRAQQLGPGHPQQYQQHLTALNLSRAALTPPLLPLLGRAVSSLSSLATLTLQGSFVEGKDSRVDPLAPPLEDAGFASLCAHLDGPLPLRRLDVSFQRLGDASCLRLGEMMCGMLPRLCAVGFRGNCTTEQGMNSLEDLLDRVGGSRRVIVDFRGNPIEQTSTAAATRGRQRVRLRGFGAKVVVVGEWDCHNNNDGWTGQDEAK